MSISDVRRTVENAEYGGASFVLDGKRTLFRVAKTTANKEGQFVALYNRSATTGKIVPIHVDDGYDFVLIATYNDLHRGVFVFSRDVLSDKGILSSENKIGKLAFRIYAPWVDTKNAQATKSQQWQCHYFLALDRHTTDDHDSQKATVEKYHNVVVESFLRLL